jgi:hypothetical protein
MLFNMCNYTMDWHSSKQVGDIGVIAINEEGGID